jgi:hypothetical protein
MSKKLATGNLKEGSGKSKAEYSLHRVYDEAEINFQENLFQVYKEGFAQSTAFPAKVRNVRLRASDEDLTPITFSFALQDMDM